MENADFVNECSEESTGKLNSNQKFCTGGTKSENYPDKVKNYIIYEVDTKPRLVKTASGLIAKVEITGKWDVILITYLFIYFKIYNYKKKLNFNNYFFF